MHVRECDVSATVSQKGVTVIYEIRLTADIKVSRS